MTVTMDVRPAGKEKCVEGKGEKIPCYLDDKDVGGSWWV